METKTATVGESINEKTTSESICGHKRKRDEDDEIPNPFGHDVPESEFNVAQREALQWLSRLIIDVPEVNRVKWADSPRHSSVKLSPAIWIKIMGRTIAVDRHVMRQQSGTSTKLLNQPQRFIEIEQTDLLPADKNCGSTLCSDCFYGGKPQNCEVIQKRFTITLQTMIQRNFNVALALFLNLTPLPVNLKEPSLAAFEWMIRCLLCVCFNQSRITLDELHVMGNPRWWSKEVPASLVKYCHGIAHSQTAVSALCRLPRAYGLDPNLIDVSSLWSQTPVTVYQLLCHENVDIPEALFLQCTDETLNGTSDTSIPDHQQKHTLLLSRLLDQQSHKQQHSFISILCSEKIARNDGSGFNLFTQNSLYDYILRYAKQLLKYKQQNTNRLLFYQQVLKTMREASQRIQMYHLEFPKAVQIALQDSALQPIKPLLDLIVSYALLRLKTRIFPELEDSYKS